MKIEPVLRLLAVMVVFFTLLLFVAEKLFPNDGQIFQVISGLLAGYGGALLMRVKPQDKISGDPNQPNSPIPQSPPNLPNLNGSSQIAP